MKPRIGVYLSEGMAARLAEAAKSPGATKSALVEAALDRCLALTTTIDDTATVARHLAAMSRQLEQLDRNLRIANETVALHARFHLAVTPLMPAAEQGAACALGAERFEEFATQVGRRVDRGVPLIRETIDRIARRGLILYQRRRRAIRHWSHGLRTGCSRIERGRRVRTDHCRPRGCSNVGLAGRRGGAVP